MFADPLAILHLLGSDRSELAQLCFLSRNTLFRVSTREAPTSSAPADFDDEREGTPAGPPEPVTFRLLAESLDPEKPGDFELLGLKGDVEVELDRRDGLPLRISGRLPLIGRVDIRLQEVR